MEYRSTRAPEAPGVDLATTLRQGLAADGGLYLPVLIPQRPRDFWEVLRSQPFAAIAADLLAPFTAGTFDATTVGELTRDAFDFPVPLVPIGDDTYLLELFHGPTLAFKDFGARFLARALGRLTSADGPRITVLVATSGDTGSAVADAFFGVAGTRVVILYPRGRVTPRQEHQMASLGGNVLAFAVAGSFDDCQRLVKEALHDKTLLAQGPLTSANSINTGRLLPQMAYYVHAWAQLPATASPPLFVVPSGNLGNLTAGLLVHACGLPVSHFLAACNANDVFPDYLATGTYRPRASRPTLANAMDVGAPSNLERIQGLFHHHLAPLRDAVTASSHDDESIRRAIQRCARSGTVLDPHTAVGYLALERFREERGQGGPAILLATAHPAKFHDTVEPLIGRQLVIPPQLAGALARPLRAEPLEPRLEALRARLLA